MTHRPATFFWPPALVMRWAVFCVLLAAGCADEPGPVGPELEGGVIPITFRVEDRQVFEKETIVYRTAGAGHPDPASFTLRAAQGALLRTLLPALEEADFDQYAGDAGYTPLAADHVAVVYAYFGFPGLFAP
ncbi:MAG: hypothetical protein SH809_16850 [Rhodothermales bacterium]|nr:hypothetical protein [Rhodothermales bacterium]